MDERPAVSAVWREALTVIRRYPFATIVPAVVLAALADVPQVQLHGILDCIGGLGLELVSVQSLPEEIQSEA
jgi:hypothetical protein